MFRQLAAVTFVATALSGCSTVKSWFSSSSDDEVTVAAGAESEGTKTKGEGKSKGNAQKVTPKPSVLEEQELKVAKLWARVDELEEDQFRLKEKIRLLEKGLTLGLVPEGLQDEAAPSKRKDRKSRRAKAEETNENDDQAATDKQPEVDLTETLKDRAPPHPKTGTVETGELSKAESERYQSLLAGAQEQFRAGRYARAAVEFAQIDKLYGTRVKSGIHAYFQAQCWLQLKEYSTARTQLVEFIKNYPASPWLPRGKVELARAELHLGMRETAVDTLRSVIVQYPHEDAAELARMELDKMKKNL